MSQSKTTFLKEKKQELIDLKKEYLDYKNQVISLLSYNTIDKNYLEIKLYQDNGFKITYSKGFVNFYAYYTPNDGFLIKARNSNELLDFETFELLNNYYKEFYELTSIINNDKRNDIAKNISFFENKINNIESEIENIEEEIENDKEKSAFDSISFGLDFISKEEIDKQIEDIRNTQYYKNIKFIICSYNIEKELFSFQNAIFRIAKNKRISITNSVTDDTVSIKTLRETLKKQMVIKHLNNKIINKYEDLEFLNFINKGLVKKIKKEDLIQQLKMINNIKNF